MREGAEQGCLGGFSASLCSTLQRHWYFFPLLFWKEEDPACIVAEAENKFLLGAAEIMKLNLSVKPK